MAKRFDKPVIVHNRSAGKDVFDILKDRIPPRGAVLHCYSEDAGFAQRVLKSGMNIYFSFAGNLTYKNAQNLHETVKILPKDRILVESESPFMVPAKYRGKRTVPSFLPETVRYLSVLLGKKEEDCAAFLWTNACRFFGLPEE
jgi:TatD DNase family protein